MSLIRHVSTTLKSMMKDVQASGEFDEDKLEDLVSGSRSELDAKFIALL
jgi:double-strand break repair protein MRE11